MELILDILIKGLGIFTILLTVQVAADFLEELKRFGGDNER